MRRRQLRVTVIRKTDRTFLQLRFRDPVTKREILRSSGTTVMREAEREAARWEDELRQNGTIAADNICLSAFSIQYQAKHLTSLAETSRKRAVYVLESFLKFLGDVQVGAITSRHISDWQAAMRASGLAETSISSNLRTLHAAFDWAVKVGFVGTIPKFPVVQRAKTGAKAKVMKGRPVTEVEFAMMLEHVDKVLTPDRAPEWKRYLRGMWLSGLRLKESLALYWDRDDRLSVVESSGMLFLRVPGEHEKGNRDRLLPITPDFESFLRETPAESRTGPVFSFTRYKRRGDRPCHFWVGRVVSEIGKSAGVVVDNRSGKFASLHDLRRSFGDRWSRIVLPRVLMELMRHESISTTMRYYTWQDAEQTAVEVRNAWQKRGDTLGDSPQK